MLFVTVQTLPMGLKLQVNVTAHQQRQVLAELAKNKDVVNKSVSVSALGKKLMFLQMQQQLVNTVPLYVTCGVSFFVSTFAFHLVYVENQSNIKFYH